MIGGGAAGFFTALTAAESDPSARITIYESGRRTLTKVKVSGGGRCNVTHHCFDPKELATRYPRGSKELRAAFHRWQPQNTIDWFAAKGVRLKTEDDGRMFPTTDDSQTIINCFERTARELGITVRKGVGLKDLTPHHSLPNPHNSPLTPQSSPLTPHPSLPNPHHSPLTPHSSILTLHLTDGTEMTADKVAITAGSLKASSLVRCLERLGHTIEPLAPSLFAFNLSDKRTHGLAGISVQEATVQTERKGSQQTGPVLITHRGLSGPAILRLSAWEARDLQEKNYHFSIKINWLGKVSENQLRERFAILRNRSGKTSLKTKVFEEIPRRLWERILETCGIPAETTWAQLPKAKESKLISELVSGIYNVQGKTTNKDEFVTCGGVKLKEINFKTMESRIVPGLHFAGESLDIDGITGGFNFQAAWTTAHIAGTAMAQ